MLSVASARALHEAGLPGTPARGDGSVLSGRDVDDEVLLLDRRARGGGLTVASATHL